MFAPYNLLIKNYLLFKKKALAEWRVPAVTTLTKLSYLWGQPDMVGLLM